MMEGLTSIQVALLSGGLLCLAFSVAFLSRTHMHLRKLFPVIFSDKVDTEFTRTLVSEYVWRKSVPASVRREYLTSLLCGLSAGGLVTAFFLDGGQDGPALLFGGVTLFGAAREVFARVKYGGRP
jgi:hypothetical protein